MPSQVGEVVTAHCSQCRENSDVEVVAVVGDEIVTVTCKTCGTSQRFRPPMDKNERARAMGRRVVDVGGSEPSPRPRGRSSARRVLSSTGREIIDDAPPRRPPPMTPPPTGPMPTPQGARPASMANIKSEDLYRRWDALTAGVMSRHGRPHRSSDSYREGEIVLHTVHGMGIVEQVAADGTLTVLFKRGYQALPSTPRGELPAPSNG